MFVDSTPSSGDQRAFYQALHVAFDLTLASYRGQPLLVEALLSQAFDSFHGNLDLAAEEEPPLACHRGCATCCTLRVGATAPEVWLVARLLRQVAPPLAARGIDLIGAIRAADAQTRGLGEGERVTLRQACPFIAQGVCVIYGVRPLACRGHASHDLRACREAAAGKRAEVPFSEAHHRVRGVVQNAMQSALREAALPWGLYELNRAVLLALDDAKAESAWLAGEDSLAEAALPELNLAEMAEVYDQLRPAS